MKLNRNTIWGGGAVTVAAATAVWTALSALPGGAYWTKQTANPTQNASFAIPATASVNSASESTGVREAAAMQSAFNAVAREAAPAVVTITTLERVSTSRNGMRSRFHGGNSGGPEGDPFGMFRQFFGPNGQGGMSGGDNGGGMSPNNFSQQQFDEGDGGSSGSSGTERATGLGSGFIIRQDGLILTNAHVVRGADRVTVTLSNGTSSDGKTVFKDAKVLGQDERSDVAVIQIPAKNLPTLALGDSDAVNVGDWAIAVGNPFGLDHTLTVGVISAKARNVPGEAGSAYLQTDASINPGNSGGPLLDIYGHVVGINNSIYNAGTNSNVGIGFAVPIDTARTIAEDLIRDGRVHRSRIGIGIHDVASEASAYGLDPNTQGVLVDSVESNSPAARAGLQPGDVITALNGKAVTKSSELSNTVAMIPSGQSITLDVLRGGAHKTITAQVEELKVESQTAQKGEQEESGPTTGSLGVSTEPLTAEIASQLGINTAAHGVVIDRITSGSLAQQFGLQVGDVIERVGQTPVATVEQLRAAVKGIFSRESNDSKSVALLINRRGEEKYMLVGQPQ